MGISCRKIAFIAIVWWFITELFMIPVYPSGRRLQRQVRYGSCPVKEKRSTGTGVNEPEHLPEHQVRRIIGEAEFLIGGRIKRVSLRVKPRMRSKSVVPQPYPVVISPEVCRIVSVGNPLAVVSVEEVESLPDRAAAGVRCTKAPFADSPGYISVFLQQ